MTYILIVMILSFGGGNNYFFGGMPLDYYKPSTEIGSQNTGESMARYRIYKKKEDFAENLKVCNDDTKCAVVGVIGCDSKGCKEYDYDLKTSPEIKNTVDLKEK